MSVGASFGRFVGKGQVIRKDGTVEPFTIDTDATREQAETIVALAQEEKSESQKQTKEQSNN